MLCTVLLKIPLVNDMLLKKLLGRLISIASKDKVLKSCNISNMAVVQNLRQSQTDNTEGLLELKVKTKVMITAKIDSAD